LHEEIFFLLLFSQLHLFSMMHRNRGADRTKCLGFNGIFCSNIKEDAVKTNYCCDCNQRKWNQIVGQKERKERKQRKQQQRSEDQELIQAEDSEFEAIPSISELLLESALGLRIDTSPPSPPSTNAQVVDQLEDNSGVEIKVRIIKELEDGDISDIDLQEFITKNFPDFYPEYEKYIGIFKKIISYIKNKINVVYDQ
jgi:hypothetical protein